MPPETRPLLFFDVESTGLEKAKDRIVSLAAWRSGVRNYWLFNPGFQMSDEVIAIHGLTNEMVEGKPLFQSHAAEIHRFFAGCDLVGYNLINFDVPILWEEFHRAGIEWDLTGVAIIDPANIFRKKEPRDLTGALRFYCGEERKDAHDARADVDATDKVLVGQMIAYPDLQAMSRAELAAFCRMEDRLDLDGRLQRNKQGDAVYGFGKSKGVRLADDPGFGEWMLRQDFITAQTKIVLRRLLSEIYSENPL